MGTGKASIRVYPYTYRMAAEFMETSRGLVEVADLRHLAGNVHVEREPSELAVEALEAPNGYNRPRWALEELVRRYGRPQKRWRRRGPPYRVGR